MKPDHAILGFKVNREVKVNNQGNPVDLQIFTDEDNSESLIQVNRLIFVKEIFITVNEIDKLDKYLLKLSKLGYNNLSYIEYRVKNIKGYKNQARKDAINAAKKKASLLTTEFGQTVGKAHSIEEIDTEDYN